MVLPKFLLTISRKAELMLHTQHEQFQAEIFQNYKQRCLDSETPSSTTNAIYIKPAQAKRIALQCAMFIISELPCANPENRTTASLLHEDGNCKTTAVASWGALKITQLNSGRKELPLCLQNKSRSAAEKGSCPFPAPAC